MKKYIIKVPRKYTQDGEGKNQWNDVGTFVHFDATQDKPEGFDLKLHMFPETKFGVFEQKPKKVPNADFDTKESQTYEASKPKEIGRVPTSIDYPTEEINLSDIPF